MNGLRNLAPQFKQTILIGYPPFIKDILDEAATEGIDLQKLNLRLQFAAESFTEQFRDYIGKKAGIKNVMLDTLNIYGTADIGAMAFETPISILIRRLALQDERIFGALFPGTTKIPTLAQYNPAFMTFKTNDRGEILLTGNSAVPLVRYAVGDHGGVYAFSRLEQILKDHGISIHEEARKAGTPIYELPFVYVYERVDLSTTLYGMQIYPEYLKDVLLSDSAQQCLTGKFQILTKFDDDQNQHLEIHIEKKPGITSISKEFSDSLSEEIYAALRTKSSEFRELSSHIQDRQLFTLAFQEAGDPAYFPVGIKQKWVKK